MDTRTLRQLVWRSRNSWEQLHGRLRVMLGNGHTDTVTPFLKLVAENAMDELASLDALIRKVQNDEVPS